MEENVVKNRSDRLSLSIQAGSDEVRANQRPDFIWLANQSVDTDDVVLYPDQWEDRVSVAER